ncbi:MAG: hypothetical protein J6K13_03960 [Clostridia bacterium]|nr:hypothetical protein [Clostridia bacterium]
MQKVFRLMVLAVLCMCMVFGAAAEIEFLPQVGEWDLSLPLEVELSADVKAHMPFDDDRCAQLNALLKHISLRLNTSFSEDTAWSRVGVRVDGKEAMSLLQQENAAGTQLQFSFQPDAVYQAGAEGANALLGVEQVEIFGLDGGEMAWLDDGYAMLNAMHDSLADYKKEASIKTAIKNMGTARTKITYTVPKADAAKMAEAIAAHCPEGELRQFLTKLVFSGQQKLIYWLNGDGVMIRAEFAGNCGVDENSLRDVSMVWRMRRDDTAIRDDLTLKTPAVKGADYNTLTYMRELVAGKKNKLTYDSKLNYTWKIGKEKTTLAATVDLTNTPSGEDAKLTGTITVKQTLPGEDTSNSVKISPEVTIGTENGTPVVNGTVTVQELRGKNVLEDATIQVDVHAGSFLDTVMEGQAVSLDALTAEQTEALLSSMSGALIPRLALLPVEDTLYLSADLPEDVWQKIVEAAQSALPEEETP